MYCRLNCTIFFTTYFNVYCTLYCKSYCTKMAYSFRKTTFPASSSMYCRLKIFLFLTHSNVNFQSFLVFYVCLHWPHLKLLSTWTKVLYSKLELLCTKLYISLHGFLSVFWHFSFEQKTWDFSSLVIGWHVFLPWYPGKKRSLGQDSGWICFSSLAAPDIIPCILLPE